MANQKSRSKPSFIEEARRRQIVEAAITAIAETGYINASLAEIAKHADISKGVISYHFDGKDELIDETVSTIWSNLSDYLQEHLKDGATHHERLRIYVESSFKYMQANRVQFVALVDLWGSFSSFEHKKEYNRRAYEPCRRTLTGILENGQTAGEFRRFPARTFASTIQAIIDGMMLQWVFDADSVNLDEASDEIIAMIDRFVQD